MFVSVVPECCWLCPGLGAAAAGGRGPLPRAARPPPAPGRGEALPEDAAAAAEAAGHLLRAAGPPAPVPGHRGHQEVPRPASELGRGGGWRLQASRGRGQVSRRR